MREAVSTRGAEEKAARRAATALPNMSRSFVAFNHSHRGTAPFDAA